MRALALIAALAAAPAIAGAPEGASPEQRRAFAAAAATVDARDGRVADYDTYACIVDELAVAAGPAAVAELVAMTEEAAQGRADHRMNTLRFVGDHGDAYYGIVAECRIGRNAFGQATFGGDN